MSKVQKQGIIAGTPLHGNDGSYLFLEKAKPTSTQKYSWTDM